MQIPIVATMPAKVIKIPRTDGSLFKDFDSIEILKKKEKIRCI